MDQDAAGGERPDEDRSQLSVDEVLDLLSHRHRRHLLYHLRDASGGTSTVREATEHLQERASELPDEDPGFDDLRITLFHVHVPELSDAGVVEHDRQSGRLRYRPNDRLETYLERIRRVELE